MLITDRRIQKVSEGFREACVQSLYDSHHSQEQLADACMVNQATISRWFSYTGESHLPAFILAALPKEVAIPVITYLADKHGCSIVERPSRLEMSGTVEDEELAIIQELGELVKMTKSGRLEKRAALKKIDAIVNLAERARAEIGAMS